MITLTESAQNKIQELLKEEPDTNTKLRMYVSGGGCSGLQYGFEFTTDKNEDDFEINAMASSVLIDPISAQYLTGATVDYKDDLSGAQFTINNPMASSTCGCGSSFSPY